MRFLESRDDHFDMCRAFLVVSMIIAHAFESFYRPEFNRNYTAYVTLGFVFLSGFTVSAIYGQKVGRDPLRYFKRFTKRALKLFVLYVACNIVAVLLFRDRLAALEEQPVTRVAASIFLGTNQAVLGLDILMPIAMTLFISWFVLASGARKHCLFLIAVLCASLCFFELSRTFNYFGVKFTLIGLIGALAGRRVSDLPWDRISAKLFMPGVTIVVALFILAYYVNLALLTGKGDIVFSLHLVPTFAMLFLVYALSNDLRLGQLTSISSVASILSQYMLFAYLFHLLLLNVLLLFLPRKGFTFLATGIIALVVMLVTVISCRVLDRSNRRSLCCSSIYGLVFK
jgi:peptidoglycan/LPS O-acetylase OafA/YrhL